MVSPSLGTGQVLDRCGLSSGPFSATVRFPDGDDPDEDGEPAACEGADDDEDDSAVVYARRHVSASGQVAWWGIQRVSPVSGGCG